MAAAPAHGVRRLKKAALARELGITRQSLGELIQRGIISADADGLIDADLARHALRERVRPGAKSAIGAAAAPASRSRQPSARGHAADHGDDPMPDDDTSASFQVARALRESEEARIAKIKRLQLEQTLIERQPATTAVYTAFRSLRDSLAPVGRRIAPRAAGMTDLIELQRLIDDEIRQALHTFATRTLASAAGSALPGLDAAAMADDPQEVPAPAPQDPHTPPA